jgi:hypothetical protein
MVKHALSQAAQETREIREREMAGERGAMQVLQEEDAEKFAREQGRAAIEAGARAAQARTIHLD